MSRLSEMVLEYQRTGGRYKELSDLISILVYNYPRSRRFFDEDDSGEFLLHFQPRIDRIIERFHDHGYPFEAYLGTNIRYQLQTYVARKQRERLRYLASHLSVFSESVEHELTVQEDTQSYGVQQRTPFNVHAAEERSRRLLNMEKPLKGEDRGYDPHSRRLLLIAMKAAEFLEPYHLENLAALTGYRSSYLFQCWQQLRERTNRRRRRLALLQHRRNRTYLQLRCYELQEAQATDPRSKLRYRRLSIQQRERLRVAVDLIERVPRSPTNLDLSVVLGIPKGSVDTGLHALREVLSELDASHEPQPRVQ